MAPKQGAKRGEGLVAVLLITRTRPGPRLVFHYPEHPSYSTRSVHHADEDDSESESEDDQDRQQGSQHITPSIVPDDARRNLDAAPKQHGQFVLGRSVESLEKVLSPGRWCDRKKFEINLNGLTFLGHPVYAPEDGQWGPKKTAPPSKSRSKDAADMADLDLDSLDLTSPRPPGKAHDFSHVPDSFESPNNNLPFSTSMQTTSSTGSDPTTDGNMTMFHLVFVLRGSGLHSQAEAQAVYQDVAKKLSRALHYCQTQANYVATESRKMLALKTKAKQTHDDGWDLWTQLVETSELAWAIKETFNGLSNAQVAGIRLNGMEMSIRLNEITELERSTARLEPLSAILLLEGKESLLSDLMHPDTSPLAAFIREHTPTKNLQKHAAYVGASVDDILYLASHLIKWRKARLISPLHQRNTYIVAPHAPIEQLQEHISAYHRLFPTLPTLPNMLKVLSGKPIKFGLLIPSRDHRTAYMNILSYLVHHNLVVQLRTFGWLHLPKSLLDKPQPRDVVAADRRQHAARYSLLSPRTRAVDDDVVSIGSEQTTIAAPSSPLSKQSRRFSRETQISAQNGTDKQKKKVPVLIADPHHPNEEQDKLLDGLVASVQDPELREALPRLVLHLDGRYAFEEIAARENWKRAKVEEWLAELESKEYLITARYI